MDNRDFNLYKIFLTLYELKSISKTANKLYVSQPAISYSLKELESQLGYNLFYRNSKGIEPTMEAKELYSYISAAFNIIKTGEDHIKNLNTLNIGEIKIGAPSHIAVFYLAPFISGFREKYPGVKFDIISKPTDDLIFMLEGRKLDLIINTLPINTNNKAIVKKMLSTMQNCFAYKKDLMPNCEIKCAEDLKKYPLILPSSTSSIRAKLDEYMDQKNIKLNPSIESWTTEFMLEMVREGVGIGYFVRNAIDTQINKDEFEVIDFNGSLPQQDVCAVYLEDFESNVTKEFVEYMLNEGGKI